MTPDLDRASRMAYKTLLALNIDSFPVDPLMILSFCKNTAVHTYEALMGAYGVSDPFYFKCYCMDGQDAVTFRREYGGTAAYELFYYAHGNRDRQRFTLAHELGHIVLKHSLEQLWEEREADVFASQLLAPRPVFSLFTRLGIDMGKPETVTGIFSLSGAAAKVAVQPVPFIPDSDLSARLQARFTAFAEALAVSRAV